MQPFDYVLLRFLFEPSREWTYKFKVFEFISFLYRMKKLVSEWMCLLFRVDS